MVIKQKLGLEDYLALPEWEKPYKEFVDGEVIEKVSPNLNHFQLAGDVIAQLKEFPAATAFLIGPELRCVFGNPARSYLPDVCLIRVDRLPLSREARARPLRLPPDVAIEILSPEQGAGRLLRKLSFYMENGVRLALVIDPDDEIVTVYEPGQQPRTAAGDSRLSLAPVSAEIELDLEALFGALPPKESP
ncbi:MAG: Uma2 family endonuclease [Dehalococcoidia bacterium]